MIDSTALTWCSLLVGMNTGQEHVWRGGSAGPTEIGPEAAQHQHPEHGGQTDKHQPHSRWDTHPCMCVCVCVCVTLWLKTLKEYFIFYFCFFKMKQRSPLRRWRHVVPCWQYWHVYVYVCFFLPESLLLQAFMVLNISEWCLKVESWF